MADHGKIDNGSSSEDSAGSPPTCPVSRSTTSQPLCQVNGFDIWRCPETATDFVWPMPDDATLKNLYDREAWFEGGETGGYQNYDEQTAPSLHLVTSLLARFPAGKRTLSILDVGCGYGNHLRLAADQHWKCFGVEPSAHARTVAQERHGDRMSIVERAEDLLPQRFDLILMLEVIEHLRDPYSLFFTLFGRGAIGPETVVVITTPNARSNEAVEAPGTWAYRHPPSHLVYYSAKSLELLLRRLMFKDVQVAGLVDMAARPAIRFEDEQASVNDELGGYLGIKAEASGSDFKEFMHERYVPGAYWKLTEYEHLPRYAFSRIFADNARVLDFGCGTGYGSAFLAKTASSVVGLDIAAPAIEWAREMHRNPRLQFELRADLGQGLAPQSFDLVTCFEMIEHVNHETQLATVKSIANLLTPEGKLVMSTPDPEFTAPYGDNPYHLREMTEVEFRELLETGFKYVTMLRQWVRPSIFIGNQTVPSTDPILFGRHDRTKPDDAPVGFVAICSNQPFEVPPQFCLFDTTSNYNHQTLEVEHNLNRLRFENHNLLENKELLVESKEWLESQVQERDRTAKEQERALKERENELAETRDWVGKLNEAKDWLAEQNQVLTGQLTAQQQVLAETENRLDTILRSRAWRALQRLRIVPKI